MLLVLRLRIRKWEGDALQEEMTKKDHEKK
jgi:hypothetical protein